MQKKFFFLVVIGFLVVILAGCQSFLEDYNYQPLGTSQASS